MKTIYLQVSGIGWVSFQYTNISELEEKFAKHRIMIGGYCELGDCCKLGDGCELGDDCKLGDGCELGGYCKLGYRCELGSYCKLGYRCELGDCCELGYRCELGYCCELGDDCKLGDDCELGSYCKLGDDCKVPKALFISASQHSVSYWGDDAIQIGCKRYTILDWQKHFRKIGKAENYTEEQIAEYKNYIDLIATMHDTWNIEKSQVDVQKQG